jgi:hypothetical protein
LSFFIIKALCRRDCTLLSARAALILLFHQLESQKENNPLARVVLRQLKIRMKERWEVNSALLKYLTTGEFINDYDKFDPSEFLIDGNDGNDNYGEPPESSENPFIDNIPDKIETWTLFEIPNKMALKAQIIKLVERLCPPMKRSHKGQKSLVKNRSLNEQQKANGPRKVRVQ